MSSISQYICIPGYCALRFEISFASSDLNIKIIESPYLICLFLSGTTWLQDKAPSKHAIVLTLDQIIMD